MAINDCSATIDETYEFSAPRFFDFADGESDEEMRKAELWFETALSYAPSPFMPKIKTGRSVQIDSLCDFSDVGNLPKAPESLDPTTESIITCDSSLLQEKENKLRPHAGLVIKAEITEKEEETHQHKEKTTTNSIEKISADKAGLVIKPEITEKEEETHQHKEQTTTNSIDKISADNNKQQLCDDKEVNYSNENGSMLSGSNSSAVEKGKVSDTMVSATPEPQMNSRKGESMMTDSKKNQTAKKIASLVRNSSALKPKNQCQSSHAKSIKPSSVRREKTTKSSTIGAPDFTQENQAIKKQKLEGGRSRQILNFKTQTLPHKSRLGLTSGASNLCSSTSKNRKEDRKIYVREQATPYVSMAEMVNKFHSKTREIDLPHINHSLSHDNAGSVIQRKPKLLTLTRPIEPEFETSHRVRSVRIKSSAELEEEMMAKIPKFKARPINKKILEAPTLPALPRSTPQLPEFQEFHLKTMERANQNAETSTVISSTESSYQNQGKSHNLTEPRTPRLETSFRARPTKVKSSQELEQEELEKMPKFKARPLNKKIFESKGDLGMFCNVKRHVTKPQEFHFATDERIPPPTTFFDCFDKLSLNSEPCHENQIPRITTPNPFHLHTEERGAEKERKFVVEVIQKQMEEERARIPKATPYPYTTDYPVIPPKPEPKQCTKPEPFQLESLARHEEEMRREMEERKRMEKEAAEIRIFKAQPIMKEDPIPVPEKARKPLTQVQEFALQVDHRAVDRAEFDKKVKEKEITYKRYREEHESAKMMEEEKALKQLRRTMVPHARPLPNFDHPFHPHKSSKEITKPKSPQLRVVRRKEERMRMLRTANAATSAAATQMR